MVQKTGYVAETNSLTIADISMMATVDSMAPVNHVDLDSYPDLCIWMAKMKQKIKGYEKHAAGIKPYGQWVNSGLKNVKTV